MELWERMLRHGQRRDGCFAQEQAIDGSCFETLWGRIFFKKKKKKNEKDERVNKEKKKKKKKTNQFVAWCRDKTEHDCCEKRKSQNKKIGKL
jgi:hypothetical protein